jgi:hypothetical protein
MIRASAIALAGILVASAATAGPIRNACAQSDRGASNVALCSCIQQVADATLTGRDQRMAARFFSDPHMAQEVRMSDRRSDEVFWRRYRAFGSAAENYCS